MWTVQLSDKQFGAKSIFQRRLQIWGITSQVEILWLSEKIISIESCKKNAISFFLAIGLYDL